jgi:phosphoglycolate phosphatase-like HAD superfamily hydrolase
VTTAQLHQVLAGTRNLLLDFDGPVCSIFSGYPAPNIATELRNLITAEGIELPAAVHDQDDPLEVLRITADLDGESLTRRVADALRDAEVTAADSAEPTSHIEDVLVAAGNTGRRVAIVSNNSKAAVEAYLSRHGLLSMFARIVARYDGMDPHYLKPNRHLVMLALIGMDAAPWSTTLVGDSVTDIKAARSAGIRSIGYANKPGKRAALADAGADAVIGSMSDLASGMREALVLPN